MKKKQLTAKKTLSVFLAVLMLMTSWVFFPGMVSFEAEAVDAGDAVAAYNKELLNQIKTDPDTNMVTTTNNKYKTTDNGKAGDTSGTSSSEFTNSYQNVLNFNNGNIVTSGTGAAATFTGVTNADSVKVWYPDTVLMYDGGKAKMAVLLEVDAAKSKTLRGASCWISGNANGLYVGFDESNPYWRGHSDDDPAVLYMLWRGGAGYFMTSDGSVHNSYKYGCSGWSFHASHIYFNGTMSDTEWVRAINPQWKFKGGSSDTQEWGPVTANGHTIYVMNIQGYKRLVQNIISKKSTLNGKEGQYTRDSLQRFVNACNKITKDLAPKNFVSTTSNNVTSWASQMNTAYTELNNAYNGLVKRNVNVGYENLFSISDWAQSLSPNLQSSSSVEIKVEDENTIKIYKNAAGGEVTTGSSYPNAHVATRYSIPVTGGKDYTVRYDIEASVNGTAQSEVFMFWYDANNNPVNNTAGSATFNNKGFGNTGACSVTFTAPASATKAEIRFDNDCPSSGSTLRFKNIAVYPAERNTAVEVDSWTARPVMKTVQYGSTLSGKLDVPVRNGYTFNGWYIDNVNVNGVKDSGEEVTDAAGNVTKSVTVTNSINLYADWAPLPMDIGYDNIFSLAEWAKTNSTKASSANGTIEYDVMAGTITAESTANGEVYNVYGTGADQYVISVKPNTEYIFEADMDLVTGDKGQLFVFFYNTSGSGVTGAIYNGTAQTNAHIGIYPTTEGTSSITFTTPADCTKMAFRVGATNVGTKAVYSNIGFYKKADYDAYAKDYATVRVPFNFGDTTNLALVPTREGYQFDGWYTANGTKLTSVTGLKASDTVYAKWTALFTVTFKNWDGTVLKTQQVAPGAAATAPQNPNRAADKDYEYTFNKWDTDFSAVTSDLVVTATFKSKDHTGISKTYQSGATCTKAATYTQLCTECGFVWTEIFEDPAMPALGHTYERENPSSTVVTGTSTGKADTDLHTIKCNACDATTQVKHDFKDDATRPGTTATCTVKGWTYTKCACLETQEIEGLTNPNNHVNTEIINKKDAKCGVEGYTGDKYCNDCKKTVETGSVIKALEHKYTNYVYNKDATCTADGTKTATCDNGCGTKDTVKAEGTMIPHSFTNYESNGDATCDADGTKTAKCDYNCGKTDTVTDTGSKRAHKFDGTVKNNNDGTHAYKCKYDDCDVYGEAVDCTYGAWTKDNAATHSHTCTACGYTPAAEAHDWSAWTTVGGSDTTKANQKRTCNVCGREETTECNYEVVVHNAATCEAAEITTYKCKDCGHGYSVIGEAAKKHNFTKESGVKNNGNGSHSFACANGCGEYGFGTTKNMSVSCSDWTYANTEAGKHTATCKVCAYAKTEDCTGGTATCTAQAVCQFCNTAYGEKAPHSYTGNTYFDGVEKAKDATCTAQAEYYTYCEFCKVTSKGTDKEATFAYGDLLPHTFTGNTEFLYKATEAKCEVNETYYVYCSECKASSKGTAEEATFEKADTALEHVWVNAQHNADTLTHTFTCERGCGETMTANCADSAVSYGYEPATCTEQGYDIVQCSACGHQWNINYTDALGHDYTQKIYDADHTKTEANCDQAKVYWYDCSRCDKNAKDETDTEKYTLLTYFSGDIRPHKWTTARTTSLKSAATCTAAAKYYKTCEYEDCKKSAKDVLGEDTDLIFSFGTTLDHAFDKKVETYLATKADCVNNATYYYVCSGCDVKGTTTWEKENSKSGHSMAYTEAKAADCYNAGNYEYWYCATCETYFKDEKGKEAFANEAATVIAKRSHDIVKVAYKAPTCEADGNPAYEYCKHEGCKYNTLSGDLSKYAATGHNFTGKWTYDTVQLCHSKLCANGCGKSGMVIDGAQVEYNVTYNELDEAVITGAVKCTFTYEESTVDGVHSHVNACVCGNNTTKTYSDKETFVETVAPTCTDKGYDSYACKDCGATWTKNEVKAKGHTAADKATSNGNGYHSVYCVVEGCDYKFSTEKCSGEATCSAPAYCDICKASYGEPDENAHVYAEGSEWAYQGDAKCGVNGTETNYCTVCEKTISREAEGTALKHKMTEELVYEAPAELKDKLAAEGIELKEPTCNAEGIGLSYCENCKDEYKVLNVAKDKSAHEWGEPTVIGNCGSGLKEEKTCERCGAKETTPLPNTGHTFEITTYIPATCTKGGFRELTCTACGTVEARYYDAALHNQLRDEYEDADLEPGTGDHAYQYVGIEDATCTEPAKEVWKCADCGDLKKEVVMDENGEIKYPALGHAPVYYKGSAADCRIEGTVAHYTCKNCKVIFADEACTQVLETVVIPREDHADNDGNGKCDECNAAVHPDDSSKFCGCICHKENFLMRIIYNIVNFFWKLFKISGTCDCGAAHW